MDALDRYQAELERRREAQALHCGSPHAPRADEKTRPLSDIRPEEWPVTIIGCIRGVDGWYQAGYDARKRTVVPIKQIPA